MRFISDSELRSALDVLADHVTADLLASIAFGEAEDEWTTRLFDESGDEVAEITADGSVWVFGVPFEERPSDDLDPYGVDDTEETLIYELY